MQDGTFQNAGLAHTHPQEFRFRPDLPRMHPPGRRIPDRDDDVGWKRVHRQLLIYSRYLVDRYGMNQSDAEDFVQDTMVAMLDGQQSQALLEAEEGRIASAEDRPARPIRKTGRHYDPARGLFNPWIKATLRSHLSHRARGGVSQAVHLPIDASSAVETLPDSNPASPHHMMVLREAVESLSPETREVVDAYSQIGDQKKTAKSLGKGLDYVRDHLDEARATLKRVVAVVAVLLAVLGGLRSQQGADAPAVLPVGAVAMSTSPNPVDGLWTIGSTSLVPSSSEPRVFLGRFGEQASDLWGGDALDIWIDPDGRAVATLRVAFMGNPVGRLADLRRGADDPPGTTPLERAGWDGGRDWAMPIPWTTLSLSGDGRFWALRTADPAATIADFELETASGPPASQFFHEGAITFAPRDEMFETLDEDWSIVLPGTQSYRDDVPSMLAIPWVDRTSYLYELNGLSFVDGFERGGVSSWTAVGGQPIDPLEGPGDIDAGGPSRPARDGGHTILGSIDANPPLTWTIPANEFMVVLWDQRHGVDGVAPLVVRTQTDGAIRMGADGTLRAPALAPLYFSSGEIFFLDEFDKVEASQIAQDWSGIVVMYDPQNPGLASGSPVGLDLAVRTE